MVEPLLRLFGSGSQPNAKRAPSPFLLPSHSLASLLHSFSYPAYFRTHWSVGRRGGLLPPPDVDVVTVFVGVLIAFVAVLAAFVAVLAVSAACVEAAVAAAATAVAAAWHDCGRRLGRRRRRRGRGHFRTFVPVRGTLRFHRSCMHLEHKGGFRRIPRRLSSMDLTLCSFTFSCVFFFLTQPNAHELWFCDLPWLLQFSLA